MLVIRILKRSTTSTHFKSLGSICALVAAAGLGACSADITRFDAPSFSLNESTGSTGGGSQQSSLFDQEPATSSSGSSGGYSRPSAGYGNASSDIEVSALDDRSPSARQSDYGRRPAPEYTPQSSRAAVSQPRTRVADYAPDTYTDESPRVASHATRSGGGEIVVRRGDTLYGLSRRHGVSISALKSANGLRSAMIRPGQTLRLPGGSGSSRTVTTRTVTAAAKPRAAAPAVETDWTGTYTMERGDSLYNVARKYGVSSNELQRVNGIKNPRRVRPGVVLKVPGVSTAAAMHTARAQPSIVQSEPRAKPYVVGGEKSVTQPTILNSKKKRVAALDGNKLNDAVSAGTGSAAGKLRWPVRGKIISGFGKRADGTHNDGVNLEVPLGSDVKAAEAGVIAYAGSELKGYGNLILVRHDNGWVTAYAHNDKIVVKRGDKVARGQTIAKAGKTGNVDRPQVHFELRQGSKPVDPVPYLERM